MDEEDDFVHDEQNIYPISSLMGDIGGAAGLFLGLNVVGILEKTGNVLQFLLIFVKRKDAVFLDVPTFVPQI